MLRIVWYHDILNQRHINDEFQNIFINYFTNSSFVVWLEWKRNNSNLFTKTINQYKKEYGALIFSRNIKRKQATQMTYTWRRKKNVIIYHKIKQFMIKVYSSITKLKVLKFWKLLMRHQMHTKWSFSSFVRVCAAVCVLI